MKMGTMKVEISQEIGPFGGFWSIRATYLRKMAFIYEYEIGTFEPNRKNVEKILYTKKHLINEHS